MAIRKWFEHRYEPDGCATNKGESMHKKKLESDKSQKVAITSMVRNPGPLLRPYIEYHLAIGFDYLFLFFDDPNDPSIEEAQKYNNVMIVKNDMELQRKWKDKEIYTQIGSLTDTEMMARQVLNVEVALDLARLKNFDWLLHIDVDELFYSPTYSVKDHFQRLAAKGVHQCLYVNYEAIPEAVDIYNPFEEVTLFKVNPFVLPNKTLNEKQKQLINLSPHLMPKRFFFYHRDTKPAVRLEEGIRTRGPHKYNLPADSGLWARLLRRVSNTRPVRLMTKALPKVFTFINRMASGERTIVSKDPIILHYPVCGFQQFWDKYVTWGDFPITVWGGKSNWIEVAGSFHIESRDVVKQGGRNLAREFYERRYVMIDKEEIRRLSEAGLVCRIEGPMNLLVNIANETNSHQLTT